MNSASISPRAPRTGQTSCLRSGFGFSLIELLVVIVLAAVVTTTGVLIYQNLAASGTYLPSYVTVNVGSSLTNFYDTTNTTLDVLSAPSYGQVGQAEIVRDKFISDLQRASAVFCLGRAGVNTIHPTTISVPITLQGRSLDTPEKFRLQLPGASGVFSTYFGVSTATNASIFILAPNPTPDASAISVVAVYDIDLTPTTSPRGTYVSVKRYEASSPKPTDYYDVFYPSPSSSTGTLPFNPLIVCFQRSALSATVDGNPLDALKQAAERPFYFIWWPDPAAHTLEAYSAPSYAASDPRSAYPNMGGRTSFFFVVLMFPAL